jgi:hypothetical protein
MNWFDNLTKECKLIIAGLVCVASLCGVLWGLHEYFETRYALADSLKQTNQRLDQKIVSDELNQTQQRIYIIQDRISQKPATKTEKEELRDLTEKKERLKKELDKK